jgi:hypothetical protein
MVTPKKKLELRPSKAPNLPIAPVQYDQRYQDQFANVLRLYFAEVDNLSAGYASGDFGSLIKFPYLSAYDTSDQHDGSTTIPYAVRFNEVAESSGIDITARSVVSTASIATTTMTVTGITSGRFYPSMLLSGTGVTSGTYVYLQLSSTATPISGTQTFVSGGGVGTDTFVVAGGAGNIEARQFVSGTGVPANTRVVSATYDIGTGNTTVVLNANFTVQASGSYVFRPWGYQGTYSVSPSQTVSSTAISGELQSMITFQYSGIYNIQFSLQFTNTTNNVYHDVDVWFRKNDVDIPSSNSQFSIPGAHSGHNGQLIAALNLFVSVVENDVVELVWHTDNSDVYIETIAATTSPIRPEIPSAIVTVSFVSALP